MSDGPFPDTPLETTKGIPSGTMVCVPSALPRGPVDAPVVAVNSIPWYKSWTLRLCAVIPVLVVIDENVDFGTYDRLIHRGVLIAVAAAIAYNRYSNNTVIR